MSLPSCIEATAASTLSPAKEILQESQERFSALKNRLEMPDSLRSEEEARYYSSRQFGAVHVLLSIPHFQTRDALAKKLELPLSMIGEMECGRVIGVDQPRAS